jgi:tRNA pseudouridine38-40 synthase
MRYFITLSYDGTAYHGWQIQPHSISVQGELHKALSTLLRQPMEVVGAGRTDTGVHARKMVAHFDYGELDCQQLVYKLNKILPKDIAVQQVEQVADNMHARFSAKSRTYNYFVHLSKDPFRRAYSWQVYGEPDFDLMNRAAEVLMEYTDFTSFSKLNTDTKTNDCTITEAHWDRVGDGQWCFTISANRFLRNMVRAIVGTLLEVGRGRMTIEQLRQVIEAKDRCRAGDSVPGNALFLVEVLY